MRRRGGAGIHQVGRAGRIGDAVIRVPRQNRLVKVDRRKSERPRPVAAAKLHRRVTVEPEITGIDTGDFLAKANSDLAQQTDVTRRRIERHDFRRRLVRLKTAQLGVHHEVAAGQVGIESHDGDLVFAIHKKLCGIV